MPFTPLHAGPHVCVGLPLRDRMDLAAFLLANVSVDVQPLLVLGFGVPLPLHGLSHTLLWGGLIGAATGLILLPLSRQVARGMRFLRLPYAPRPLRSMLSGLLGAWLHILTDALIYSDVRPFWPGKGNPLNGSIEQGPMYIVCALLLIPAGVLWWRAAQPLQARRINE